MRIVRCWIFFTFAVAAACAAKAAGPTYALTTLATFNGANGSDPVAGLVADAAGNLYGTAVSGGSNNLGTVFEIATGTHAFSTRVNFTGSNGSIPNAGLVTDPQGNIYGAAYRGGINNNGTIFGIAAGSHAFTTLAMFNGTNGTGPLGFFIDQSGNIYGSTSSGGQTDGGTVYQVDGTTHAINTIASFNFQTIGSDPLGGVVADANGNLFGTLHSGGDRTLNSGFGAGRYFQDRWKHPSSHHGGQL